MKLFYIFVLIILPYYQILTKLFHHYELYEPIPFFVNKIGPYNNPTETYEYYSLPFCKPETIQHNHANIGEDLSGDHKVNALYVIRFNTPINWPQNLCTKHLIKEEIEQLKNAIEKFYYYEMVVDDLPLRGFIGNIEIVLNDKGEEIKKYYLFTHLHFHFLYNNDQIIFGNITADSEKIQELKGDNLNIEFTYSVSWEVTDIPFKDRMKLYEDFFSKELEIHWLSIMNSFILVLLLTGFISIILMKILKNDYSRYSKKEEEEEDDQEDYGWKLVHGDVFRFPSYKNLFCAFIGLGFQNLAILFAILFLALVGMFYPNNGGTLYTAAIILYALTSFLGGFISAFYFKQMGGEKWAWNIILVSTLYSIPVFLVFSFDNTLAIIYNVTTAVPFTTILTIIFIILGIGFPLNIVGGIAGRRIATPFDAPCRTKNFPREIPPIPWYRSIPFQMIMAGFLPFSAIYIELFYLFSSVWGHTTYQLFGILFLVAIILIIVTACITISLTYFQLSMEDHKWWWNSFLNGGSTGIFIYLYTIFYYIYRSKMNGILQASYYFTYMALVCYFFFIMLGTVGWYSSLIFVRRIYKNIKCD